MDMQKTLEIFNYALLPNAIEMENLLRLGVEEAAHVRNLIP